MFAIEMIKNLKKFFNQGLMRNFGSFWSVEFKIFSILALDSQQLQKDAKIT